MIGRDLRDRPGRWGSAGGSFPLIALLILLALAPASGRDEAVAGGGSEAGSAFGSILLDAYIDDGGRALIVGYLKADSLSTSEPARKARSSTTRISGSSTP